MASVAIPSRQPFSGVNALCIGLAGCALSALSVWVGLGLCLAAALAVCAFLYARRCSPREQAVFLMFALQLNIFSLEFGDRLNDPGHFYSLRPALPVAIMLLSLLFWRVAAGQEHIGKLPLLRPLIALDAVYWIVTFIHPSSPYFFRGLISCTLLGVNVGIFLLFLRPLLAEPGLLDRVCRLLIMFYTVYALAGILMLAINLAGLDPHDYLVQVDTLGAWTMEQAGADTPTPHPWSFEPNTGSQMAAVCLLALTKAFQPDERHRYLLFFSAASILAGLMLTFARGPWVGFAAGIVASVFILRMASRRHEKRARPHMSRNIAIVSSVSVITYLVTVNLFPYLKGVLLGRLLTLSPEDWQSGTMFDRLVHWIEFIQAGLASPILGHGADNYKVLLPPPRVSENFIIESFHVAGIWGPLLIGGVQIVLFRWGWQALRRGYQLQEPWLAPALCAYSGFIVAAQMNPSMWGGFYWMLLAIVTCILHQSRSRGGQSAATAPIHGMPQFSGLGFGHSGGTL
jgi:hypothetical protein